MVNSGSTSIAALSSSFLAGLDPPAAHAILSAARIQRISAGRKISTEGYRATHFYLLQKGRARLYHLTKRADLVLLSWLVPGDVTGLVAILKSPPPYLITTEAKTDCDLLTWEHSVICKLASLHPLLAENTLRIALSHLRTYVGRHIGLATKSAEERVAEALLKLSDKCGQFHPEGIEIRATNDELGALADVSPFTASRVLGNWQRAGTLSKGRGRIVLRAPEALMID